MGKSHNLEIDSDEFEYAEFIDMEADFENDELLDSDSLMESYGFGSEKEIEQLNSSHRHLPDDWKDFDYDGDDDSSWN